MYETEDEIAGIQRLIDTAGLRANPHMSSIVTPDRRLTARQVVTYLQGTKHVAFATVTELGEPRVSPLDSLFIHGRFTIGTGAAATRVRHLRANPACSAVHMDGERIAVVVNGHAEWLPREHPDHDFLIESWDKVYGSDPNDLGDVVFFRIVPDSMWTFASHPEQFPEE